MTAEYYSLMGVDTPIVHAIASPTDYQATGAPTIAATES